MRTLTIVVQGESGAGKSWLGDTAPAPRLVLDAEGGSRFTPSQPKVLWNPMAETPPVQQETVIVNIRDFDTVLMVFQWLNSGQHDFRSVIWDSLTEIQKKCLDAIVGTNVPLMQDWGTLLRQMEGLVRQFRDLTMHPTRPLEVVCFITLTRTDDIRTRRPSVQGQLSLTLPQFVDVVGYLYTEASQDGVGLERTLLVQPYPGFVAKDRTNRLGQALKNPNLTQMMEVIYG